MVLFVLNVISHIHHVKEAEKNPKDWYQAELPSL